MDSPYLLVLEDSPDPADLALLEDYVAAAAIAAGDVGNDREFGIFVRDDEGRVIAGISGLIRGGMYERLGYETVGIIEGYPAGTAARWFRKNLPPDAAHDRQ